MGMPRENSPKYYPLLAIFRPGQPECTAAAGGGFHADLTGADIDFLCLPLWFGSLKMITDRKQRVQIAFHLASLIKHGADVGDDEKALYNTMLDYVNEFHRGDVSRLEVIQ